jgi:hypothetical protein
MIWRQLTQTISGTLSDKQGVTCMSKRDLRDEINRFPSNISDMKDEMRQSKEEKGASQPTSLQEQVGREIMSRPVRPDEEAKQQYPGR